jgi:hypothetical protein
MVELIMVFPSTEGRLFGTNHCARLGLGWLGGKRFSGLEDREKLLRVHPGLSHRVAEGADGKLPVKGNYAAHVTFRKVFS